MQKKNMNFRVMAEGAAPGAAPTPEQAAAKAELAQRIKRHKRKIRKRILIILALLLAAAGGIYLLVHLQTYTRMKVLDTYESKNAGDSSYVKFGQGVLKYSKDGVALLDKEGDEKWNRPYEIKNPLIDISRDTAAIGDKQGNKIVVLTKDGDWGEITTTLPIEKVAVSDQGIVCAILKKDNVPEIICYDKAGNILVEHQAAIDSMGYPFDADLAPDGRSMVVSYLQLGAKNVASKVGFYRFSSDAKQAAEVTKTEYTYSGTMIPKVVYLGKDTAAAVGDNQLVFYRGGDKPKEVKKIALKSEVEQVFSDDKRIGIVQRSKADYVLRLYNAAGKEVLTQNISDKYDEIRLVGGQILLYDGTKCQILLSGGIEKFKGEADTAILEMFPVFGINKYLVMNANGMEIVRLTK